MSESSKTPTKPGRRIVVPAAKPDPTDKAIVAAQLRQKKLGAQNPSARGTEEARSRLEAQARDTPLPELVRWLADHTDPGRMTKAVEMLKAASFQLYAEVAPTEVTGVVRSQFDPELVYSSRLRCDGHFCCTNQHLELCGGMRGYPCKHLMVLLLGLAASGQIDPGDIRNWLFRTRSLPWASRVALEDDRHTQIFIKYKAAQAGEVDWRPTSTIPEDFYAL